MHLNAKRWLTISTLLTTTFLFHTLLLVRLQWRASDKTVLAKPSNSVTRPCEKRPVNHTEEPNCESIFAKDPEEICTWSAVHRPIEPSDGNFATWFNQNRISVLSNYPAHPHTLEEASFPIAYSISIHKHVAQFERLLRLIYWPQNLYCVHVDGRSPPEVHQAVQLLSAEFPNVFVASRSEYVYWAGFGVLQAVLNCMNDTLHMYKNHTWRYFINLSGMDFPLKTNLELVRILRLLNGSNDVEFGYELQFSRYWLRHRVGLDDSGRPYTHWPDLTRPKPSAPHKLKVYKGNLAATLSRRFVEYLFTDDKASEFIDWLEDTDTADEHLWATLNFNSGGNAPGGYPVQCHTPEFKNANSRFYVSRLAHWRGNKKTSCHGKYVRDVCIFGVEDLQELTSSSKMHFFLNKFYMDYQSAAFYCMEKWFRRKTRMGQVDVNETFYATLPNVIYRNFIVQRDISSQIVCPWKQNFSEETLPQVFSKLIKATVY